MNDDDLREVEYSLDESRRESEERLCSLERLVMMGRR